MPIVRLSLTSIAMELFPTALALEPTIIRFSHVSANRARLACPGLRDVETADVNPAAHALADEHVHPRARCHQAEPILHEHGRYGRRG